MSIRFAAIADDVTGGSDLAGMLCEQGVRTLQLFGVPDATLLSGMNGGHDAVVVCLKSRSVPPADAVAMTLEALDRLQVLHPAQVQFKYCSTFDSTREGNIGPVTEALLDRLGVPFTVAVPALPVNGRTQYLGHLFVNGQLLSESPLRHHPLNPMDDPFLVRHLQAQTSRRVGLVPLPIVQAGPEAIRAEFARLQDDGIAMALVDAVVESDLDEIAEAVVDLRLITGGSGLARTLPAAWRRRGLLPERRGDAIAAAPARLGSLVLAGSCSAATLGQLERLEASGCPVLRVDVSRLVNAPEVEIARLAQWAIETVQRHGQAAVRSSTEASQRHGSDAQASSQIEAAFGSLARRLVDEELVGTLIVAGGETSGAVVKALKLAVVEVVTILDPGVPGLRTLGPSPLRLALKSGNFGSPDFFLKAMRPWEAR